MKSSLILRHVCFAALLSAFAIVSYESWRILSISSLTESQDSQILLVLPVSAILVYVARRRVFADVRWSPAGVVALLATGGLFALARVMLGPLSQNNSLSLAMLGFVLWCLAAFLLCYGSRALHQGAFPLLFLFLMVPLPDRLLAWTTTLLQVRSTDATCFLFRLAHIPYTRQGVVLVLPKITIEVARECSSIHSSLILFTSSFVLAYLYLGRFWQRALLPILAIPVSVAKNAVRIFSLSTLGMYVDAGFLSGNLHHHGGIVFFALGFAILLAFVWLFHRLEPPGKPPAASEPVTAPPERTASHI